MNNKAIVTVNVGGYDTPKEPEVIDEGFDYLYFSDTPIVSDVWENMPATLFTKHRRMSNHLLSRSIKTGVCNLGYKQVVYMDSNMQQIGSIQSFIDTHHKDTLTICQHPARNCIYEEAKECIRLGFSPEVATNYQMLTYMQDGYPKNNGLIMGGFFVVNVDPFSKELFQSWWDLIEEWNCRDQFCFNRALWEKTYYVEVIPDSEVFGKVVKTYPHIRKR